MKKKIRKSKKDIGSIIMAGYDYKIIKDKELNGYLNNGWEFVRNEYFYSCYLDLWSNLNADQKISISAIAIGSVIGILTLI